MSSLLNTSSHFDKANASTVEGTQLSVQHMFDMSTEIDPAEQRHNSMNLALGKPTQQFNMGGQRRKTKGSLNYSMAS